MLHVAAASTTQQALAGLSHEVVLVLCVTLGSLALAVAPTLALRWRARRHRRYVRMVLVPYRSDEADSQAVRRLFEAWHQQLLERWWRRLVRGQRGISLEVVIGPDAEGDMSAALAIVCPHELAKAIEGSLVACYPDSRLVHSDSALPPVSRVIRLKKRAGFERSLRGSDDAMRNLIDAALNQMVSLGEPAVLQYTIVPTPAWFDGYARLRARVREQRSASERAFERQIKGEVRAPSGIHHPLFFSEIRVAATTYKAAAALAGTIRGESAAENRLIERYHRPWATGRLYLPLLHLGVASPLPSWRRGVLSSDELGGLWHLPSPGLKTVRLVRSAIPRLPAPPQISRREELAIAHDERGPVGILPVDKSDGLGLIGGQKTGKTSVLCRTVRADALDPACAMIVLMPKPGDARKALSMVPKTRTVHYLDLEHPEFGINPLMAVGDPAMVADKIVDAFRDVNVEGDIRGSSDRYLRQAAQAAIGASRTGLIDGPPTLWHMYRMLLPSETAFRERVVGALLADPRYADTATFFGRELPGDLRDAAAQTTAKLDAPRNKLLRLMVESLDKVLRHPLQVDLDAIVRRREVLIVDGKMGTFGADNCRVMMQFILNTLYGALQRQQQLDDSERVRVSLKVDEAHLIINESFADALATLRSAGLEVTAAWQYGEQIQDPKIRSGMMSLLRQRCMFSMGEEADAREMSTIAMAAYSDMIRTDPESRARMLLTPDTIFNLPNHHALCSWISNGVRVPAFIAQTIQLTTDEQIIEHHLASQRERGYHVPDGLPDPLPDLDWDGPRELPTGVLVDIDQPASEERSPNSTTEDRHRPMEVIEPRPTEEIEPTPRASARHVPAALGEVDPATTPTNTDAGPTPGKNGRGAPETFTELDLDDVRGILWDNVATRPADRRHEPTGRELEILAGLWSYRFLFATQIWRRWWRESSQRAAQQGLNRMTRAGWVRRFKFQLGERGAQQRVYCLTKDGFELIKGRVGRHGPYVVGDADWREPQITDPRRILRDLHINGWVLALEDFAGRRMGRWRGPRDGRLLPPRRKVRGEWVDLRPRDVVIGSNHVLHDYGAERFGPVSPDATVELRMDVRGQRVHVDVLVEIDRSRNMEAAEERLRRYDGLISGWGQTLDRYRTMGTSPIVVFVSEDERGVLRQLQIADRVVTARIAKAGTDEVTWPFPGRRGMFFAVERDMNSGSLTALQLPEHPPELRVRLEGTKAKACRPRRVHIIEPRLLRDR